MLEQRRLLASVLVSDFHPAPTVGPRPYSLGTIGGKIALAAAWHVGSTSYGSELWTSDGTTAGTTLLKDINPGTPASSPSLITSFNGVGYFSADDGVHGRELWRTDGTAAGTWMFKEVTAGSAGTVAPGPVFNGKLYFTAESNLWVTDGTDAGTSQITTNGAYAGGLLVSGSFMYFRGYDAAHGYELWRTNGNALGTTMVADLAPGTASGEPSVLTNAAGTLFFTAYGTSNPYRELWKFSGSTATLLKTFDREISPRQPLLAVGAKVFFIVRGAPDQVWVSTGTAAGTIALGPLIGGFVDSEGGRAGPLGVFNNKVYYFGPDSGLYTNTALWQTDGTVAGTTNLKFLEQSGIGSNAPAMSATIVANSQYLYFASAGQGHGGWASHLWQSDGTAAGTTIIENLAIDDALVVSNDRLFLNSFQNNQIQAFFETSSINGTGSADSIRLEQSGNWVNASVNAPAGPPTHQILRSTVGSTTFSAGSGDDSFVLRPLTGTLANIVLDGGIGTDALALLGTTAQEAVTFNAGSVSFGSSLIAALTSIESQSFDGGGGNDSLTINAGLVSLAAAQKLAALNITGSGKLDLVNRNLVIDYTGPSPLGQLDNSTYTGLLGLLASGRNGGDWNGNGIMTTAATAGLKTIAIAEASKALGLSSGQTAVWNGQTVDATSVLIGYTFAGDANLSGRIDADDYFQIDSHFGKPSSDMQYLNGDFDYNGTVDGDDYFIIDSNYATGMPGAPAQAASPLNSGAIDPDNRHVFVSSASSKRAMDDFADDAEESLL